MESDFDTFLFGNNRIAAARSGCGKYTHTFGGAHDRKGASREDCNGIHIHLLHRLDLTDPVIPFDIPGVRWLPLYYCFDGRGHDFGYRLISDKQLVTFFPENDPDVTGEESRSDDERYPLEFPKSDITIENYDYDPANMDDAYEWAGVFGIGNLSTHDQAVVKGRVAELMKRLDLLVPETDKEFEDALCRPFMQGKDDSPCLNPKCVNRDLKGQLTPFALMPAEPVEGICTFGEWGGGVQLIFRICPKCHTIRERTSRPWRRVRRATTF